MDRGSLRALAKAAGAGDLNLTDAQINSLIDNAIRDISTYLPTNRVPRLVERAGMGEAINENPNFDESDGTTVGGYELVNGSTVSTAAAGLLTGNTYSVLVDQSSGGLKTVMFPVTTALHTIRVWIVRAGGAETVECDCELFGADKVWVKTTDLGSDYAAASAWAEVTDWTFTPLAGEIYARVLFKLTGAPNDLGFYIGAVRVTAAGVGKLPADAISSDIKFYVDDEPAQEVPPDLSHEITSGTNTWLAGTAASPKFSLEGSTIRYAPTDGSEMNVLYKKAPLALPEDGAEPPIPVDAQTLIIPYVSWWASIAKGQHEESQVHKAAYMEGLQRVAGGSSA